jgi:apolipoprotein N-acyltransferase
MWGLSYLGSTWALVLVVALCVVALGALAWLSANWKLLAAAVLILAAGFAYMHVDKQAYARRVAEESVAKVKRLEDQISTMNKAAAEHARRTVEDAGRIADLESKVNDTPPNSQRCLDRAGARRVRDIR